MSFERKGGCWAGEFEICEGAVAGRCWAGVWQGRVTREQGDASKMRAGCFCVLCSDLQALDSVRIPETTLDRFFLSVIYPFCSAIVGKRALGVVRKFVARSGSQYVTHHEPCPWFIPKTQGDSPMRTSKIRSLMEAMFACSDAFCNMGQPFSFAQ